MLLTISGPRRGAAPERLPSAASAAAAASNTPQPSAAPAVLAAVQPPAQTAGLSSAGSLDAHGSGRASAASVTTPAAALAAEPLAQVQPVSSRGSPPRLLSVEALSAEETTADAELATSQPAMADDLQSQPGISIAEPHAGIETLEESAAWGGLACLPGPNLMDGPSLQAGPLTLFTAGLEGAAFSQQVSMVCNRAELEHSRLSDGAQVEACSVVNSRICRRQVIPGNSSNCLRLMTCQT